MRVRSVGHTGIECALVCWCALQLAHWQRVVRAGIGLRIGVLGLVCGVCISWRWRMGPGWHVGVGARALGCISSRGCGQRVRCWHGKSTSGIMMLT